MKKGLLTLAVVVVYALHQDVWFWRSAPPLVFGFLPIGLAYHAGYSILAGLLMWLLVTHAWPHRLEEEAERRGVWGVRRSAPPSSTSERGFIPRERKTREKPR